MTDSSGPALVVTAHGGIDVLAVEDRPAPDPAPGEVLVEVAAAGINFIDVYQREGVYPDPTPFVGGQRGRRHRRGDRRRASTASGPATASPGPSRSGARRASPPSRHPCSCSCPTGSTSRPPRP